MTREELREHCERQIQQFERVEKIMPVTLNDWKRYEEHKLILELLEQGPRWIPVSERLPNKNQWVLATTEDYQKIAEVMCYQGIRIGQHDIGNGWEEYEYPSWTSGHGDIQGKHPKAWMPLPAPFEP